MREKFNAADNGAHAPLCERAEDLVVYLYGEASASEAKSFEQHKESCVACRRELAAFGVVREAVGEWRAEALSITPSLAFEKLIAPESNLPNAPAQQRSARAALREFFKLSPLWLRFGTVAATLAVCALAALVLARTEIRWNANGLAFHAGVGGERVVTRTVEVSTPDTFTREQVDGMIKGEVARALEAARTELAERDAVRQSVINADGARANGRSATARVNIAQQQVGRRANNSHPNVAARGSNQLVKLEEEERATSLYDLLRVVN